MKHRNPAGMDRIISFVNDFYRDNRRSPTGRQIAAATGISLTTVQRMLKTMTENGTIDYDGQTIVTDLSLKTSEGTVNVGIIGSIPCGNLALIRKQEEARNGDIVVAFVEGEGNTLKRYKQYGNTVFLHPENPKYRDIPLLNCKIQGIAINVIKKL